MFPLNNICNDIDTAQVSDSMICSPENLIHHININHNALTVMHTNIRSVSCNFDALTVLLERLRIQCDILILTECWLSTTTIVPSIHGYTSYSSEYHNQNDGVIIYVKADIKHSITNVSLSGASCLVLRHNVEYAVVAVYRSPSNSNIDNFCDSLDSCLLDLRLVDSVAVIGDININIASTNSDLNSGKYLDLLAFHGFSSAHSFPTRNESCLDHVMLRSNKVAATYILDSYITDHAPLVFCLQCNVKTFSSRTTFTKIDYVSLLQTLSNIDFNCIFNSSDANAAATLLTNMISDTISMHSKQIKISHRKRTLKPWLTPGLVKCIRHRDKLHKKIKIDPTNAILRITYTRYRNFCNNLLKKLKAAYEKNEFQKYKNNPKGTWNTINKIVCYKKPSPTSTPLLDLHRDRKQLFRWHWCIICQCYIKQTT